MANDCVMPWHKYDYLFASSNDVAVYRCRWCWNTERRSLSATVKIIEQLTGKL